MSGTDNPLMAALELVFGPLVKQSQKWPVPLAYGLPGLGAVVVVILARTVVPDNLVLLLALVILAPLIAYIAMDARARRDAKLQQPGGPLICHIVAPCSRDQVDPQVHCFGTAINLRPDQHLWLAIEVNNLVWFKEGEVVVDRDNRWTHNVFEDGATGPFSLSLFLANPEAHQNICKWLEDGRSQGAWAPVKGIPGTQRLERVADLTLRKPSL